MNWVVIEQLAKQAAIALLPLVLEWLKKSEPKKFGEIMHDASKP